MRHLLCVVAVILLIEVFVSAQPTRQEEEAQKQKQSGLDVWKSENGQHKISIGGLPTPSPGLQEHMSVKQKERMDKDFGGSIQYTWNFPNGK